MVVNEAWSMGKPVLASELVSQRETIRDLGGLVAPNTVIAWADAIRKLQTSQPRTPRVTTKINDFSRLALDLEQHYAESISAV